jgi:hypothetical protein
MRLSSKERNEVECQHLIHSDSPIYCTERSCRPDEPKAKVRSDESAEAGVAPSASAESLTGWQNIVSSQTLKRQGRLAQSDKVHTQVLRSLLRDSGHCYEVLARGFTLHTKSVGLAY